MNDAKLRAVKYKYVPTLLRPSRGELELEALTGSPELVQLLRTARVSGVTFKAPVRTAAETMLAQGSGGQP